MTSWRDLQAPCAAWDCAASSSADAEDNEYNASEDASHRQGDLNNWDQKCRSSVSAPPRSRRRYHSIATMIFQRECKPLQCVAPRSLLHEFRSLPKNVYYIDNSNNGGSPPFSLQYGKTKRAATLAVADEDGYVSMINTGVPKDERRKNSHSYSWLCHRNAIFDVAFTEGDDMLATASGDQTIRIWDLSGSEPGLHVTLRGHSSSVKAVQFRPGTQCQVVSGAREGNIFLWDTREAFCETEPVQKIIGAHVKDGFGGSIAGRHRRSNEVVHHSVTSLAFLDDTVLASAGANDGTVKLWDLRKAYCQKGKETPIKSFMSRQASATGRPRGISSLALNSSKTKLLASSADHHLYVFDCIRPEQEPVTFRGHVNNSFYVKSSFSPDDRFIVSGSSDYDVYIWDVARPLLPPLRLKGHVGEVSDVDWCPNDLCKLASSSDDTTVRIWTIDRSLVPERDCHDPADLCLAGGGDIRAGHTEVPASWTQPASRSEDDLLACMETMVDCKTYWRSDSRGEGGSAAAPPRTPGTPTAEQLPQMRGMLWATPAPPPASNSPSSSPTLRQARLDDIWKPVPRSARASGDCVGAGGAPGAGKATAGGAGGTGGSESSAGGKTASRYAGAEDARLDLSTVLPSPDNNKKRKRRSSTAAAAMAAACAVVAASSSRD